MLGQPNTNIASNKAQTSNRTVHSKRQTEKENMSHNISPTHSQTHPSTTKWKVPSSHQVSVSVYVFVGGRCVTCSGVIVDRFPLKLLCRTDSCLVCTPVAGGVSVCMFSQTSHSSFFSLPPFLLLSISFILPLPSSSTFLPDSLI